MLALLKSHATLLGGSSSQYQTPGGRGMWLHEFWANSGVVPIGPCPKQLGVQAYGAKSPVTQFPLER